MGSRGAPAAVLWDMDGTLIDSEPHWIAAEQELVAEHGGKWTHEQALQLVGRALLASAALLKEQAGLPESPPEIVDRLQSSVIASVTKDVPWRPGARELLAELNAAGVPCALVTASYGAFAEAVAAALPAGSFEAIVAGDAVDRGKPHPEPYLQAAARLGADPAECVAIEDSLAGIASATAAGAQVLGVQFLVPLGPELGISRLATLEGANLPLLARVASGEVIDRLR